MSEPNTPTTSSPRLLTGEQVQEILQLRPDQVDWLVSTRQLNRLVIAGVERYESSDVNGLVETYSQISKRKN